MRRARTKRYAGEPGTNPGAGARGSAAGGRWRANGWPVLPLRLFLAGLFGFAGYAKLSYPGFFSPSSPNGLKASVDAVRHGTPIGGALGPLSDHPSLFGHLTAYAEIAIGLGLLVGLLTRLAALGGMVLTGLIVLSINWSGVKAYTGSSGWFTSVDLAVAAALSVFLLGGAGPFSLDGQLVRARERDRARDDYEPGFGDDDIEGARRRLQGEPPAQPAPVTEQLSQTARTTGYPATDVPGHPASEAPDDDPGFQGGPERRAGATGGGVDRREPRPDRMHGAGQQDDEYRDDPEPEPNSLWTQGRRTPEPPR